MRSRRGATPATVEEYLASVPDDMRVALQRLRKIIKSAAPDAEEIISYRMPAFRQNGMLVYYAAFRNHCSLFVGGSIARKRFAAELKPYASGESTVHFTTERQLPADLVRRIVRARVAENRERVSARLRAGALRRRKQR